MTGKSIKHLFIVLMPILLIGCDHERKAGGSESERKARSSETGGKATCAEIVSDEIDGEIKRKARVQALIKQLAAESPEKQKLLYAELRDIYVRKRDIPYLNLEISRNNNSGVTEFLRKLIAYIEKGKWRLPNKDWTDDRDDLFTPYYEKSKSFESTIIVRDNMRPRPAPVIVMEVYFPDKTERSRDIIDLVLTLEPETLSLIDGWKDISFLGSLINLQELSLDGSKVDDLKQLKKLTNLLVLQLKNSKVIDLTPLKEMSNLRILYLEKDAAFDLTPLRNTTVQVIFTE